MDSLHDDPGLKDARLRAVTPMWLARFWGVHVNTIYRDIGKRALPAYRLPGGQYRILLSDAKRYGRPVE